MIKELSGFVFFVTLLFCASVFATENHVYQGLTPSWNIENGEIKDFKLTIEQLYIDVEEKSYYLDRIGQPYTDCTNDWICLNSFVLNFAIPINWDTKDLEWSHNGFSYRNKGASEIKIFGKSITFNMIEVINSLNNSVTHNYQIYYYSKTFGIVGMTVFYPDNSGTKVPVTYWLINDIGYGASP